MNVSDKMKVVLLLFFLSLCAAFDFDFSNIETKASTQTAASTSSPDVHYDVDATEVVAKVDQQNSTISNTSEIGVVEDVVPTTTSTTTATTTSTSATTTTTEQERLAWRPTITATSGTSTNVQKVEVIVTRSMFRLMDEAFRQHLSTFEARIAHLLSKREEMKEDINLFNPTFDDNFFQQAFDDVSEPDQDNNKSW